MSAAQQPNSGTEQEPARPAISSPDLPVAPVESFEDPVARKLAVLRSRWFVPEATVAKAVGLGSATALRAWTGRQTLGVYMFGADAESYDRDETEYWLLGDKQKPTAAMLGFTWRCADQRFVVNMLENNSGAVRHGLYNIVCHEEEKWQQLLNLAYDYPNIFYMTKLLNDFHRGLSRIRARDIEAHFCAILKDMTNEGIVNINNNSNTTAPPSPPVASKTPEPPSAPPKSAPEPRRKISFFTKTLNPKTLRGNAGRPRASIQTELSIGLFEELCISQTVHAHLLESILTIWDYDLTDSAPGRSFSSDMMKTGSTLAKGMMGLQIMHESTHPQESTASVDGVSIGEYKGIATALTKRTVDLPVLRKNGKVQPRRFVSLRLGLTALSSGSDKIKQRAIQENLQFLVDATNVVHKGEDGFSGMHPYHAALVIGATVNDHAESVVKNRFVPWLQKLIDEQETAVFSSFGAVSREEACRRATTFLLCINRNGARAMSGFTGEEPDDHAGHNVPISQWKKPALMSGAAVVQPKKQLGPTQTLWHELSTTVLDNHVTSYGEDSHRGQSTHAISIILRHAYSERLQRPFRRLAEWQYFCGFHKLMVTETHAMAALTVGEKEGAVGALRTVELAAQPVGTYTLGNAATTAIFSVSTSIGKRKKTHETLCHTGILKSIRHAMGCARLHFERLLGSRGASGVFANAYPTFQAMLDEGEWGLKDFLEKLDAASKSTNRLHAGIGRYCESDVAFAQLRIMALLFHGLLRPLQTYIQCHSSQKDLAKLLREYKEVLEKCVKVQTLTVASIFDELPWRGDPEFPSLISVTKDTRVKHKHTDDRRKETMDYIINAPGLPQDRQCTQLHLMPEILRKMCSGLLAGLKNMMDKKYGDLFTLPEDDEKWEDLDEIPSTSDAIEKYFGIASWLKSLNPNLTEINLSHHLDIVETKVFSRLIPIFRTDPERVERMVRRARENVAEVDQLLRQREARDIEEKQEHYEEAQKEKARKANATAEELKQMEVKAKGWTHCPLNHPSERRPRGGARRAENAILTINSLVRKAVEEAGGAEKSDKQQVDLGIQWVVDWLTVFGKVHRLDQIKELEHIFYHGSGRKSRDGVYLSLEQLKASLADCSAYVHYRERRKQELAAQRRDQVQEGEAAAGGSVELPPP